MTLKFKKVEIFFAMHLPTKFHHPMFNGLKVTVFTSKRRDSVENIHLAPLCYGVGESLLALFIASAHNLHTFHAHCSIMTVAVCVKNILHSVSSTTDFTTS